MDILSCNEGKLDIKYSKEDKVTDSKPSIVESFSDSGLIDTATAFDLTFDL